MTDGQVGPRNDVPAVVERLLPFVGQDVIPAYGAIGAMALMYAQGSLVAGYTSTADLDLWWCGRPTRHAHPSGRCRNSTTVRGHTRRTTPPALWWIGFGPPARSTA